MHDIVRTWNFMAADVNEYYAAVCKVLMEKGTETSPRGRLTKELHPTTVLIQDPRKRVVTCHGRIINFPFALAEVIQILTGQNDAQALAYYNSGIIDIQGDGPRGTPYWQQSVYRFNAAYGERLRSYETGTPMDIVGVGVDQLEHVIETLKRDPDSRQASIVLSHPGHDHYSVNTRDRACNVYAHAMIRNKKLDWMQIIRSNDAIWGIPYNLIQWSHVQEYVAASLDVQMGHMFIVQDSFHVYEDKYEECAAVEYFDMYKHLEMQPLRMQAGIDVLDALREAEHLIRSGMTYTQHDMLDLQDVVGPYWSSVLEVMQSFAEFKRGHDDKAFEKLPAYAEMRVPLIRTYCHHRWNKDKRYADLLSSAYLELESYGVRHEEAKKWLGAVQSPS